MTSKKELLRVLNDLEIFYSDLNRLIVKYDAFLQWESTASKSWEQKGWPYGILSYQQYVYICNCGPSNFLIYNLNDEKKILENQSFKDPSGIDIDEKNNILYIADKNNVTMVNLKLEIVSSWKLPEQNNTFRGLKIDNNRLFNY